MRRRLVLLAVTILIAAGGCAPRRIGRVRATAISAPELEAGLSVAAALVDKGCYVSLKKAIPIFRNLRCSSLSDRIAFPFAKALILMTVRGRELGILGETSIQEASRIIGESRSLQFLTPYLDLASWMYPKTRGVMKDIDTLGTVQVLNRTLKNCQVDADMRRRACSDSVLAYLYVTFRTEYAHYFGESGSLDDLIEQYRDTPLFRYRAASTYPRTDAARLQALLASDSEFYEAEYHLGELALGIDEPLTAGQEKSDLFRAEKHFQKAQAGIPEAPLIPIYLGGICLFTEEFDKAMSYFERALKLAPSFRDALLGRSICLSYLGKHEEAIDCLKGLLAMGSYLMGESHYWLAWNFHELNDGESARMHIEEAEKRLPTDSEVFCLAGTLSLEMGHIDAADKEFTTSLEANGKNIKAVLGLGRVFALKKSWLESADFYAHAVSAAAQQETFLADEIRRINDVDVSPVRKISLMERKEMRRKALVETEAKASYEAAIGYLNGGQAEPALRFATKAAAHPNFKEPASHLIDRIKLRLHIAASRVMARKRPA
jgi:tetratricopeptide (TPR) repeat protein